MLIASASLAAYFARWIALRAFCLMVWSGYTTPDATEIAESIATAVMEEAEPTFDSVEEDAAVMAYWARAESGLRRSPRPQSWDSISGQSIGIWQTRAEFTRGLDIQGQARYWVDLLRRGAVLCPENPAAPLSGGCHGAARRLADSRVARVRGLRLVPSSGTHVPFVPGDLADSVTAHPGHVEIQRAEPSVRGR